MVCFLAPHFGEQQPAPSPRLPLPTFPLGLSFTTLSALFDFAAPLFLPIAAKGGLDKDVFPDEEAPAQETPAAEAAAEVEAAVEQ